MYRKTLLKKTAGRVVLGFLLFSSFIVEAQADVKEGKAAFDAKNCATCHQMSGPTDPKPVTERSEIKGPPLWFAGNKFKQAWLTAWLENPTSVRRVKYGTLTKGSNDHPAVSASDAQTIGEYLMSLEDPAFTSDDTLGGSLARRNIFKADKLFSKKQVCFGCHEYPSKRGNIGGFAGPSLVGAGERLNADWVHAYLKDPIRYYPDGRMPVYGEEAFDAFTDDELRLLSQYIGNM